jgi:hypothetical protein
VIASGTRTALVPVAVAIAYSSGVVSAAALVFLVAMFVSFAAGATSLGPVFGLINDALIIVWGMLLLPLIVAVHRRLRQRAPVRSGIVLIVGVGGIVAILVLQALLLIGALTFQEQIGPVSVAFLVLAAWFVMTGYLGRAGGVMPHGVRMGILGATQIGYPLWAFWLARRLAGAYRAVPVAEPASALSTEASARLLTPGRSEDPRPRR